MHEILNERQNYTQFSFPEHKEKNMYSLRTPNFHALHLIMSSLNIDIRSSSKKSQKLYEK